MSFFMDSFIPSSFSLNPALAWSLGNGGKGYIVIDFPFTLDSGWYQEQRCTEFHIFQHRKERNGFRHEFIVLKLINGSVCRVERTGDPNARLNALVTQGSVAQDLVQCFGPEDKAHLESSDLISEITLPCAFEIRDVLKICRAIKEGEKTCNYTLQVYNCYFFSLAIQACLTRFIAHWEDKDRFRMWLSQINKAVDELSRTDQASPPYSHILFRILSIIGSSDSSGTSLTGDIISRLQSQLTASRCSPNIQQDVEYRVNSLLWYSTIGSSLDEFIEEKVKEVILGALKERFSLELLLTGIMPQTGGKGQPKDLSRKCNGLKQKAVCQHTVDPLLDPTGKAIPELDFCSPLRTGTTAGSTGTLADCPPGLRQQLVVLIQYLAEHLLWVLHVALLSVWGIMLFTFEVDKIPSVDIEHRLSDLMARLERSDTVACPDPEHIVQEVRALVRNQWVVWNKYPWDATSQFITKYIHVQGNPLEHLEEYKPTVKVRFSEEGVELELPVSKFQEHILRRIKMQAKEVESFRLGSAAKIEVELQETLSQVWKLIRGEVSVVEKAAVKKQTPDNDPIASSRPHSPILFQDSTPDILASDDPQDMLPSPVVPATLTKQAIEKYPITPHGPVMPADLPQEPPQNVPKLNGSQNMPTSPVITAHLPSSPFLTNETLLHNGVSMVASPTHQPVEQHGVPATPQQKTGTPQHPAPTPAPEPASAPTSVPHPPSTPQSQPPQLQFDTSFIASYRQLRMLLGDPNVPPEQRTKLLQAGFRIDQNGSFIGGAGVIFDGKGQPGPGAMIPPKVHQEQGTKEIQLMRANATGDPTSQQTSEATQQQQAMAAAVASGSMEALNPNQPPVPQPESNPSLAPQMAYSTPQMAHSIPTQVSDQTMSGGGQRQSPPSTQGLPGSHVPGMPGSGQHPGAAPTQIPGGTNSSQGSGSTGIPNTTSNVWRVFTSRRSVQVLQIEACNETHRWPARLDKTNGFQQLPLNAAIQLYNSPVPFGQMTINQDHASTDVQKWQVFQKIVTAGWCIFYEFPADPTMNPTQGPRGALFFSAPQAPGRVLFKAFVNQPCPPLFTRGGQPAGPALTRPPSNPAAGGNNQAPVTAPATAPNPPVPVAPSISPAPGIGTITGIPGAAGAQPAMPGAGIIPGAGVPGMPGRQNPTPNPPHPNLNGNTNPSPIPPTIPGTGVPGAGLGPGMMQGLNPAIAAMNAAGSMNGMNPGAAGIPGAAGLNPGMVPGLNPAAAAAAAAANSNPQNNINRMLSQMALARLGYTPAQLAAASPQQKQVMLLQIQQVVPHLRQQLQQNLTGNMGVGIQPRSGPQPGIPNGQPGLEHLQQFIRSQQQQQQQQQQQRHG
ncbi:unnamed protein product [Rhizoctonia solani]|uniref:Uncharacterized protein n=1 Tax=Rhizoctonia solani TaxID=456999 RepID=A0A8H3AL46_9AGAM|nr:unnamed protein product [Rhizoctonia solani]